MPELPSDNADASLYPPLLCLMADEMESSVERAVPTFRRVAIDAFAPVK
jgi:hypothetical protein